MTMTSRLSEEMPDGANSRAGNDSAAGEERSFIGFYTGTAGQLLATPTLFFMVLKNRAPDFRQPLGFLLTSGLLMAAATLTMSRGAGNLPGTVVMAGIFLLNALGMTLLATLLGYIVMTMSVGKKVVFLRLFEVYAFAAGITLLISWAPAAFWLTEPWKWWLVYTGLTRCCEIKPKAAVLIIGVSIVVIILLFRSLMITIGAG